MRMWKRTVGCLAVAALLCCSMTGCGLKASDESDKTTLHDNNTEVQGSATVQENTEMQESTTAQDSTAMQENATVQEKEEFVPVVLGIYEAEAGEFTGNV